MASVVAASSISRHFLTPQSKNNQQNIQRTDEGPPGSGEEDAEQQKKTNLGRRSEHGARSHEAVHEDKKQIRGS